ncbi:MAG: biotin/lipoyl-binding protein [Planctomycetes bacterium]|nr:biotin/lipoyl-binding protein [Planctomycetota bacterium]
MKQLPKLVAFGLLGTILSGCSKEPAKQPIRPVRSIKVGDVQAISGRGWPGKAKATDELNMSFRVSGPLVEFKVKVGDQVDVGQVLVRIDPRDFNVQLRRSEANLQRGQANLKAMQTARPADIRLLKLDVDLKQADFAKAEKVWKRNEPLVKTGAVTEQELDILTAAKDIAEAARDSAGESLEKAKAGAREEDKEAQKAEIKSLEAAVEDAQNRLEYTEL